MRCLRLEGGNASKSRLRGEFCRALILSIGRSVCSGCKGNCFLISMVVDPSGAPEFLVQDPRDLRLLIVKRAKAPYRAGAQVDKF